MHFNLTMKQSLIKRTVRKYSEDKLAPVAFIMDKTGEFPFELAQEMAGLNYFGLEVSSEYGGAGLDSVSYSIVIEEISRCCAAMGLCVSVHNSVATKPVLEFGNNYQKKHFLIPLTTGEKIGTFCLTEPNAGSDASSLETVAERRGDEYIINGNKVFVTNGGVSGINLIFAYTNPAEEKKEYSVFIVESERDGIEKGPVEDLMGMRGNPVCPISLKDCNIPLSNRLGEEGEGMKIALSSLAGGRIGIASQSLGIAQAALDVSIKYSRERRQFGKNLSSHGAIKNMLADMAIGIETSRLLIYKAALLKDQKKNYIKESAMAKLFATKTAVDATKDGVQIHGGYGYTKAYPIERFYRDAKVCEIYEGTSEIQRIVIARNITSEFMSS